MDINALLKGMMGGRGEGGAGGRGMDALMQMLPKEMLDGSGGGLSMPEPPPQIPKLLCGPGVLEAEDDWSRWWVVYPHYIDSCKTIKEGRRLGRDVSVEKPTAEDLYDGCMRLRLRFVFEDKCYPRDALIRGRVRIDRSGSKISKIDILKELCVAIKYKRRAAETDDIIAAE